MRLWHKDLIPVLPRQQLIAQWRECCAIASNIANKGTPNHILVNKVLDYPSCHFTEYTNRILKEMHKRGYKVNEKSYLKFCENMEESYTYFDNLQGSFVLYEGWHNDRYLLQCIMNLQEKYDCGMFDKNPKEVQPLLDYINKKKIVY